MRRMGTMCFTEVQPLTAWPRSAAAQCTSADGLRRTASTWSNVGFWSFIGAGAVGAATVAYAVLAPRADATKERVHVAPLAGLDGGGLSVTVRW